MPKVAKEHLRVGFGALQLHPFVGAVQGEEVVFDGFFLVMGLCWFGLRGAEEIGINGGVVHDDKLPAPSKSPPVGETWERREWFIYKFRDLGWD